MSRVLLDTHALIWWFEDAEKLSARARTVIEAEATTVFVSAASAWELGIKSQLGKFRSPHLIRRLSSETQEEDFTELPITIEQALRAGSLKPVHKDPFDRMLIAQAQIEDLPIVSKDHWFDDYGVARIW